MLLNEIITEFKSQLPPGKIISKIYMNAEGERLLNEYVAALPILPNHNSLFGNNNPLFQGIPLIKDLNRKTPFEVIYEDEEMKIPDHLPYPFIEIKGKPPIWSECEFEKYGSYCSYCRRGPKKESEEKIK